LKVNLRGYNFSSLAVWQAYLQKVNLPEVNFTRADLAKSAFTETFGSTYCVALSPRGDLLAAGTTMGEIRLWRTPSGLPLQTLRGHTNWVHSVTFSPDGKTLSSGGCDGIINLWESQSGVCLRTLRSDRPYERMNIMQVTGLTEIQKATLKSLGAIECDSFNPKPRSPD
jgi:WD40 repeat protein